MAIKSVNTGTGGFFKPEEYLNAAALLIEVKSYQRERPTNYGPKDSALVDLTVFATEDEAAKGKPTNIIKDMRIEGKAVLTGALADIVGDATIQKLKQGVAKKGQNAPWLYADPTPEAFAGVAAYYEAREAQLAAAIADAPDFD